jgi:hypothetical protein
MQRLGDPTAESVGRPFPTGESMRDLSRLESTALDKRGFQKRACDFFERCEHSS